MSRARALLRLVTDGRRRYSQSSRVINPRAVRRSRSSPSTSTTPTRRSRRGTTFLSHEFILSARTSPDAPLAQPSCYVTLMAADYGSENPSKLVELCAEFICRNLDKFTAKSPNGTPFFRTPFILSRNIWSGVANGPGPFAAAVNGPKGPVTAAVDGPELP